MTFEESKALTVTLTFQQAEAILSQGMGWEDEDVTSFWKLANYHSNAGGQS